MALVSRDTRQMACKDTRQVVVVKMREFHSEFCLLHRRGIDVLPKMLWGFWD